jgi:hypothetical protein
MLTGGSLQGVSEHGDEMQIVVLALADGAEGQIFWVAGVDIPGRSISGISVRAYGLVSMRLCCLDLARLLNSIFTDQPAGTMRVMLPAQKPLKSDTFVCSFQSATSSIVTPLLPGSFFIQLGMRRCSACAASKGRLKARMAEASARDFANI